MDVEVSTSKNGSTVMTITEDSLLYCSKKKEKKRTKNRIERTEAFKLLQNDHQFNLANCKTFFLLFTEHTSEPVLSYFYLSTGVQSVLSL